MRIDEDIGEVRCLQKERMAKWKTGREPEKVTVASLDVFVILL